MTSPGLDGSKQGLTLAEFTNQDLLAPQLQGADPASVLEELIPLLQRQGRVPAGRQFHEAVLRRETLGASDWEEGVAFPHGRLATIERVTFALGRSRGPLRWGLSAQRSVRLVFLTAVPLDNSAEYLGVVAGLVRLAKDKPLLGQLLAGESAGQMLEVLRQVAADVRRL